MPALVSGLLSAEQATAPHSSVTDVIASAVRRMVPIYGMTSNSTSIADFLQRVLSDPALEQRFRTATTAQDIVAMGSELGFNVDADALAEHFSGTGSELTHIELERVTGGAGDSGSRLPVPPFWRP